MISSIYENALKRDSSNEKLFTHLFMAYVRLQDYKKQQLTALNLYKVCPKNPYYFWAVMSIYMQAISSNDEIAFKITLPLAEKMCQKFYIDNKFETDQEIELYLMILEKQKKFLDMINIIDSPPEKYKMNDPLGFVKYRKVLLLKKEGRFKEAFDNLVPLIKKNPDQYDYYIELYNLSVLIDKPANNSEDNSFEFTLILLNLVDELCNSKTLPCEFNLESDINDTISTKNLRAPFIAKIVILHLIQQSAKNQSIEFGSHKLAKIIDGFQKDDFLINFIFDYFQRFAFKFVCVKDIVFIFDNIYLSNEQVSIIMISELIIIIILI